MWGRYLDPYSPRMPRLRVTFDRHLSGPRLLISPMWFLGHMIRRLLLPIRPMSRESSWMIRIGYQGRECAVSVRCHDVNHNLT